MTGNNQLRQARREKGLTQRHLALEVGVEEQSVRKWEKGERTPRLESLVRLCAILEKTPEELGLPPLGKLPSQEASSEGVLQQKPHLPDTLAPGGKDQNVPSPQRKRYDNRQRMLQRVRSRWITGILEHSLYRSTMITLHLQEQPDAVENPWRQALQEANLPPHLLPTGSSIIKVYDEASGIVLILGEPGGGKTTLLLELTRTLLERAQHDESHPMPVVFHMSSWAQRRQPFTDWLIEELNSKYQVPRMLAHSWVMREQILPLLDGLDEVVETQRAACVAMINSYRQGHGMLPMVVCCRTTDYFTQAGRLLLHTAVVVQPLTTQQIDNYLFHAGDELTAVRVALQNDLALQEMVSTPLILNIVAHTYHGISSDEIFAGASPDEHRHLLFDKYVERVLHRRGETARQYTPQQTKLWLSWLAQQLASHSQTEFYLERIQPDWLLDAQSGHHYRNMVVRLVYGMESMVIAALFALMRGGSVGNISGVGAGLLGWLGSGPGNTILGWMAPGLGGGLEGGGMFGLIFAVVSVLITILIDANTSTHPLEDARQRLWRGLSKGLFSGFFSLLVVGLLCGLLFWLASGNLTDALARAGGFGLFTGLIVGLLSTLVIGRDQEGSSHVRRGLVTQTIDGLAIGGCSGLSFGITNGLMVGMKQGVTYGIIVGLAFGAVFGFGGGINLVRGLGRAEIQPAETVAWNWLNTRKNLPSTFRNGLMVGLYIMVIVTIVIGTASGLFYGPAYGVAHGLVYGPIVGLIAGVASILTRVLNAAWSSEMLDEHQLVRPNEGIHRSIRNGTLAAVLFGPVGGLTSGLISGFAFGIMGRLPGWPILATGFGIVFTLVFALEFVMIRGGIAWISHYLLRWRLWRRGAIPWNYVRFLDYAAERILLRKIGGGYIFAHRLLLDYFATLERAEDPSQIHSFMSI